MAKALIFMTVVALATCRGVVVASIAETESQFEELSTNHAQIINLETSLDLEDQKAQAAQPLKAAFVAQPRQKRSEKLRDGSFKTYKNKKLLRVHAHPGAEHSVESVMNDLQKHASLSEETGLDIWDAGIGYVDIMVSQEEVEPMIEKGHHVEALIGDVQGLVDQQTQSGDVHPLGEPLDIHTPPTKYLRYDDLQKYYQDMALQFNSEHTPAKWIPSIGKSFEGRDIGAIRFGGTQSNKVIFFQAGIHAREWISPSTVLHTTHELLTSTDEAVRSLVNNTEFVVIPSMNPDGYEFTHLTDRMWRKNRNTNNKNKAYDSCIGIDLNRNWDDHWAHAGASTNECSFTYAGSAAFSEPETKAVSDFMLQITKHEGKNMVGAIDWHSYSQVVLRPYDWAKPYERVPPNEKDLTDLALQMSDKMSSEVRYTTEHASELYRVAGSAMAWHYSVPTKGGAAYTIELRDTGAHGFVLPADQIKPVAKEIFPSIMLYAQTLKDEVFSQAYFNVDTDQLLTDLTSHHMLEDRAQ